HLQRALARERPDPHVLAQEAEEGDARAAHLLHDIGLREELLVVGVDQVRRDHFDFRLLEVGEQERLAEIELALTQSHHVVAELVHGPDEKSALEGVLSACRADEITIVKATWDGEYDVA